MLDWMPTSMEFQAIILVVLTSIAFGLVSRSPKLVWPSIAMAVSLVWARIHTELAFEAHTGLYISGLICMAICLRSTSGTARAIAYFYVVRMCVYGGQYLTIYTTETMWTVNAYLVLTQAIILVGGAISGMVNRVSHRSDHMDNSARYRSLSGSLLHRLSSRVNSS